MSVSRPEEQLANELSCPICLQLYTDPVSLPCGHNYCWTCISQTVATEQSPTPVSKCPECRTVYQGHKSLQRNFKLRCIIDSYMAASSAPDEQHPNPDPNMSLTVTTPCDQCIDEPTMAVKTCLKCEVSLCSRHLQRHNEKEQFRSHTLVDSVKSPGSNVCSIHHQPLKYFCSSDMFLLCSICFVQGHHQNHDVLTFSVAEEEMRRALESRSKVVAGRLQLTEGLLQKTSEDQGVSEAIGEKLIHKALTTMESMDELVDRYRDRLCVLLEEERCQRRKSWEVGLSVLEGQQQQLVEAQRRTTEALNETDTYTFIQRFRHLEEKLRSVISTSIPSKLPSKAPLNTRRLQAGLKTQDFRSEMTRLLDSLHILLNPLDLTFNLVTAHPSLIVSNDLRTIKYSSTKQQYADHPERFTTAPQILCRQSISNGEHVWVVEMGASCMWSLGVCYKTIPRRGDHSRLGHNSVSWRLQWKNGKLTVCQSSSNIALGEMTNHPQRIEIALDYEGGTLAFHSTKGRREHLHTFRAVFREPLYPVFSIHSNTPESWITLYSGM
ncbi:E3 ubiquitin/ISG15 ligase TRIM25-like [Eucyclogobius newberryi]|uniref:E3 ubiquitin/ISG15 ligase TRIM25-like n=1 Tax=Eucyclogobius newberryi TaxID=166745 RepID=UPI003B5C513F